jgi:probable HAF family extracellular repeat protein
MRIVSRRHSDKGEIAMWSMQGIRKSTLAACTLLLGAVNLVQAVTYRVEQITPAQVGNTTYTISGGNQYLNDLGQVVGEGRTYSDDTVYNTGSRAFRWSHGRLRPLGTLGSDALGYGVSIPSAINDVGLIAGRSRQFVNAIDHGPHAFVWQEGRLLGLETGALVASEAVAMNARGEVAGAGRRFEQGQDRGTRAILWTEKGLLDLGTLGVDASGHGWSVATAINCHGQVVGASNVYDSEGNATGQHAFLWAKGAMHDLGVLGVDLGYSTSSATAINCHGQVVGASDVYDSEGNWLDQRAFLWADGAMHELRLDPGYSYSTATAINKKNQVLGWSNVSDSAGNGLGPHALLWTKGTMQDVAALCLDESSSPIVPHLNDAGQVVGCSTHIENGVANGNRAFLYQNGATVDLNTLLPADSGVLLENALAINNRGQITAFGTRTTAAETYQVYVLLKPLRR